MVFKHITKCPQKQRLSLFKSMPLKNYEFLEILRKAFDFDTQKNYYKHVVNLVIFLFPVSKLRVLLLRHERVCYCCCEDSFFQYWRHHCCLYCPSRALCHIQCCGWTPTSGGPRANPRMSGQVWRPHLQSSRLPTNSCRWTRPKLEASCWIFPQFLSTNLTQR